MRTDGITYDTLEVLDIRLSSGNDRFNVRGTLASDTTRLNTGAGDDVVFVSDAANVGALDATSLTAADRDIEALHGAILHDLVTYDDHDYHGTLDEVDAQLDIDTGTGSNTLAVSDNDSAIADTDFTITESTIIGLATGGISYTSAGGDLAGQGYWPLLADGGQFGRGITIHLSEGADEGTIASVRGGTNSDSPFGYTVTTVYGNEGNDDITVNAPDVAAALLVVHGDEGDDIIDGDAAGLALDLFGDQGFDTLTGGSNADRIIGDDGRVYFLLPAASIGFDVVLGGDPNAAHLSHPLDVSVVASADSDFNTADVILTVDTSIGITAADAGDATGDTINARSGNDIVLAGAVADFVDAAGGHNIVIGDFGHLRFIDGAISWAVSSDTAPGIGGVDEIDTLDGDDLIIGGQAGDVIRAGNGNNIVIGDNGEVRFDGPADGDDTDALTVDLVRSIAPLDGGGEDDITTGSGDDLVIAGLGGGTLDTAHDTVVAGDGDNVVLGDNGRIELHSGELDRIVSTEPELGGIDEISTGVGNDTIVGGYEADRIIASDLTIVLVVPGDDNLVIGDSGEIEYTAGTGVLEWVDTSIAPAIGGVDEIDTLDGDDLIIGGQAGDVIRAGNGNNIVIGDNGRVSWVEASAPQTDTLDLITSIVPNEGGADKIWTGSGNDFVIGGTDRDEVHLGAGNDLAFGDHGKIEGVDKTIPGFIDAEDLPLSMPVAAHPFTWTAIDTQNSDDGGNDEIHGNAGDDIILGQQGSDIITGGTGDDDLIGGHNVALGQDAGDTIDGGADHDVILGDNGSVLRTGSDISIRIRQLDGGTLYDGVTGQSQANPTGVETRLIFILDHASDTDPTLYGGDDIAGGADDDLIFGQLGEDTIQGDGSVAAEDGTLTSTIPATDVSVEATTDGDDYIEGGGHKDTIFGNLGQDDIIGGSSNLFGLALATQRPDVGDVIFGGSGQAVLRNDLGDTGHDRDADVILGDNGNIYRIVPPGGGDRFEAFAYVAGVIPRVTELLDYSPIGEEWYLLAVVDPAVPIWTLGTWENIGGGDVIRAEDGDDIVRGATGDDTIFGDAGDDDLYGEAGEDWISGGTGDDGILGDDGRIFTTRNGIAEPLYGLVAVDYAGAEDCDGPCNLRIDTPGDLQVAYTLIEDEMYKSVQLDLDIPDPDIDGEVLYYTTFYVGSHDIAYGGWGNDFIHGGEGDDALSGAEAPELTYDGIHYWNDPFGFLHVVYGEDQFIDNIDDDIEGECTDCRNVLQFAFSDPSEFRFYDELDPLARVFVDVAGDVAFLLDVTEELTDDGSTPENNDGGGDGKDTIFGDGGNDWIVGGTGHDRMFGGWGNDLLNADDVLSTSADTNNTTDTSTDSSTSFADIAYGGAGRDVLIANTGADRLIDWVGEFNSYIVPFSPYGAFAISRQNSPALRQYVLDLGAASGADITRGPTDERNGEPFGELGMVIQKDDWWGDQTGAPDDPQAGNLQGRRDVLRNEEFDVTALALSAFAPDSGDWSVVNSRYESEAVKDSDSVSLFYVDAYLPSFYEVTATVSADKAKGGYKSNAYLVFDYQSTIDYKFAGIEIGTGKVQIGVRTEWGMQVLAQANWSLVDNRNYDLVVQVNGQTVTLHVDGVAALSHTFTSPLIDPNDPSLGVVAPLTDGMTGVGSFGSKMRLTQMAVQTLAPEISFTQDDPFDVDPIHDLQVGTWSTTDGRLATTASGTPQLSLTSMGVAVSSIIEMKTVLATNGMAGLAFDAYGPDRFKFAALDATNNRLVIGFWNEGQITILASTSVFITADMPLEVRLDGTGVAVILNGAVVLSHGFYSVLNDGLLGTVAFDGTASFDHLLIQTDDPELTPALPLVSVADISIAEGDDAGQVTVIVTLSRPADAPITIDWSTVDGTAVAGEDYGFTTGTITIGVGEQSGSIVVDLIGDGVEEADEYFTVAITGITGGFIGDGSGRVTIGNDDTAVTVSVTVTDDSASEVGTDGATFVVTREGATNQPLDVRITWSGSAVRSVDYTVAVTGGSLSADGRTLTIAAGSSTATLEVTPLTDTDAEGVENVILTIDPQAHYAVGNSTSSAAIQDDSALPTLSVLDIDIAEGNRKGWVTVAIELSAPSTSTVTVTVRTYDGTASAGSDYNGYVGSVSFGPGQTTATVDIRILGDRKREGEETFTLELSGPVGAVIADGVGTVTIWDDDGGRLVANTMGTNDSASNLSAAELDAALDRAIASWVAAGIDPHLLSGISIELAALDGVILAEERDGHLVVDLDAAGWGWHLDPNSPITSDRIDLMTVLLHEIGHTLGFEHTATGLMMGSIDAGTRLPIDKALTGFSTSAQQGSMAYVVTESFTAAESSIAQVFAPISAVSHAVVVAQSTQVAAVTRAVVVPSVGRSQLTALVEATGVRALPETIGTITAPHRTVDRTLQLAMIAVAFGLAMLALTASADRRRRALRIRR